MSVPIPDPTERGSPSRHGSEGSRSVVRQPRPRSTQIQNAVIGVAILTELIWLVGNAIFGGPTVFAATPRPLVYQAPAPPSGGDVLLDLAAAAAAQPALTRTARTPYAYMKTVSWRLTTEPAGKSGPSRVLPVVTESWTAPDGAGRVLTVPSGANSSTTDAAVPAGQPLPVLSMNQATLARLLTPGPLASDGPSGGFVGLAELARRQPISPPVEAAILRLLARIPGLTYAGTVTDRERRPGIAVTLDLDNGVYTGYTLIFDQRTGRLLGEEETLIGNPKRLDVQPGSVIAYTTFLASGYVTSTTVHP